MVAFRVIVLLKFWFMQSTELLVADHMTEAKLSMSLDQIIGKQTQFQPQEHYSNGISNGLHNSNGNGAMLNGRATRGNGRGASLLVRNERSLFSANHIN